MTKSNRQHITITLPIRMIDDLEKSGFINHENLSETIERIIRQDKADTAYLKKKFRWLKERN